MTIPEELLPVIEWWEKDGRQTVAVLAVAAAVAAGYYGFKGWRESRAAAASESLLVATQTEELEEALAGYSGTASGPALRMRLAKKYYDSERYEEALAEYEKLDGAAPDGFDDVPAVGRAQCLEALGRFEEALKAFDAFADAKPKSFLALSARIGAARCVAQLGEREKALERLASVKDGLAADDSSGRELVDSASALVRRWEKREAKTLFDAADAAAKQIEEIPAAAEPSPAAAVETPADAAPAEAEKPAAE